jgi:aminomethyltransferase
VSPRSSRRESPLLEVHKGLGARLTEFAGWDMPLQFEGVIAEHRAVREAAGLFDVSHLGKLRVAGAEAGSALQRALTADVEALGPGRATYSLVLTDDGGCVDDVFVYRLSPDSWMVVPNAANNDAVAEAIAAAGSQPVDEWDRWAILALQGPHSFEVFGKVFDDAETADLKLHAFVTADLMGETGLVARTGYTGERGFELYAPAAVAPRVFSDLLEAGATAVGLGARDTLRLEMGYALYGHELTLDINPVEAGLSWAIAWDTDFRGRAALEKVRAEGPARKLYGLVCRGKGIPRQGHRIVVGEEALGEVTSGNHSPTLSTGIALALGPAASVPDVGAEVSVDTGRRAIPADIVKPPFIKKGRAG